MNNAAEWGIILTEDLGEVVKELNEIHFRPPALRSELAELKTELIQLAAVAVSMVEHIEMGLMK